MRHFLSILFSSLVLYSCAPSFYYQHYRVTKYKEHRSPQIQVHTDFWSNGGTTNFTVHNLTDSTLYIDLFQSHLVMNGEAFTYFVSKAYTSQVSNTVINRDYGVISPSRTVREQGSSTSSISLQSTNFTQRFVSIPPKSYKRLSGYSIAKQTYKDCNLNLYPRRDSSSIEFNFENSPYAFRQVIAYGSNLSEPEHFHLFDESYYVSSITNIYPDLYTDYVRVKECPDDASKSVKVFNYKSNYSFYIPYTYAGETNN
jgi:hypothetical protein